MVSPEQARSACIQNILVSLYVMLGGREDMSSSYMYMSMAMKICLRTLGGKRGMEDDCSYKQCK